MGVVPLASAPKIAEETVVSAPARAVTGRHASVVLVASAPRGAVPSPFLTSKAGRKNAH